MESDHNIDNHVNPRDAVWDDSLLIDAYQRSTKLVNAKIKELQSSKSRKREISLENDKSQGDDGINHHDDNDDDAMQVSNSDLSENKVQSNEVSISSGVSLNTSAIKYSANEKVSTTDTHLPQIIDQIVPPQPPQFLDDALSSMLMSWYMCGYQTGYYAAKQNDKG